MAISEELEYSAPIAGTITALNGTVVLASENRGSLAIRVSGTWAATLTFEGTVDGTNWIIINAVTATYAVTSTTTVNANFILNANGYIKTRVRASAFTSGTVSITSFSSDGTTNVNALQAGTWNTNVDFSVLGGKFVPTITPNFRVHTNITNVTVPAAYTNLYNRSGTGLFFGFQTDFNSANVYVKLTIDGNIVFEQIVNDIKQFQFNDTSAARCQMGGFLTTIGNTLDFSTRYAIPYNSSVSLDVKRSDTTNHTNNNFIIFLTEDS